MFTKYLLLLLVAATSSWLLTYLIRQYAFSKGIIDIPNSRSSHTIATPRGGGISFVVIFLLGLTFLYVRHVVEGPVYFSVMGGALIIVTLGWFDDHNHVSAGLRLAGHFLASILAVSVLVYQFPALLFGYTNVIAPVLFTIIIVWLVNLFNFMDGIDGIASIETLSVCIFGALLGWLSHGTTFVWLPPLLLAAPVSGFIVWNFPVAKIFMGDAGSGFLGFMTGVFSLLALSVNQELFWSWVILVAVFVTDSTVTLIRRIFRGQKFYVAHHSHAYQHAARRYRSHVKVTLAVLTINMAWLFPIAFLVSSQMIPVVYGLLLAYFPLIILTVYFQAGIEPAEDL